MYSLFFIILVALLFLFVTRLRTVDRQLKDLSHKAEVLYRRFVFGGPTDTSEDLPQGPDAAAEERPVGYRPSAVQTGANEKRDRTAVVLPYVFQIGFNKCGTASLYHLFQRSGVPSAHWTVGGEMITSLMEASLSTTGELLPVALKGYRFFSDMENVDKGIYIGVSYFKLLDAQYPGSKFILNTRGEDRWIRSRLAHTYRGVAYVDAVRKRTGLGRDAVVEMWRQGWRSHHVAVKRHFRGRPESLFIFDIEKDDPSKIIDFVGPDFGLDLRHWGHSNASKPLQRQG